MQTVSFAKTWRWPLTETSYEEYPAGSKVDVSNDRAEAASKAGVLDGEPVEAKNTASRETEGAAKPTGPKA